jgi:uncharacterized membrane protein YqjE
MEEDSGEGGILRESLAGIRGVFRSSADNAASYLRARSELFRIEAEEASDAAKSIGRLSCIGGGLVIVGYGMLLLAVIFYMTESLGETARLAVCLTGLAHLLIGVIVLVKANRNVKAMRWFHESREQWKQDQLWIEKTLKASDREKRS